MIPKIPFPIKISSEPSSLFDAFCAAAEGLRVRV